jgi:hypothetical protein
MPNGARFPAAFIFAVVACLAFYAGASLALDPLRVFGTSNFNRKNFEPNARYLQIERLKQDRLPTAFVLGSSRVNFYDVADLRRMTHERFYNLSASMEGFEGIDRKVSWLLHNRHVTMVVIGLDYDLYDVRDDRSDVQHVDHPGINGEWPAEYFARALFIAPELLAYCVIGNLEPEAGYRFDPRSGQYSVQTGAFDQGEHLVSRERLAPDAALHELRDALAMLDAAHVRHVEIVPPYSEERLMQFDSAEYRRWLARVVAIAGDVWDFGDDNAVARDRGNYLDISHFNARIGRDVLARVFGAEKDGVPPDFGVRVTAGNVRPHLDNVRVALAQARSRARFSGDAVSLSGLGPPRANTDAGDDTP